MTIASYSIDVWSVPDGRPGGAGDCAAQVGRVPVSTLDQHFIEPTRGRRTTGIEGVRRVPCDVRLKPRRTGGCPASRGTVADRRQRTRHYAPVGASELLVGGGSTLNSIPGASPMATRHLQRSFPKSRAAGRAPRIPRGRAAFPPAGGIATRTASTARRWKARVRVDGAPHAIDPLIDRSCSAVRALLNFVVSRNEPGSHAAHDNAQPFKRGVFVGSSHGPSHGAARESFAPNLHPKSDTAYARRG